MAKKPDKEKQDKRALKELEKQLKQQLKDLAKQIEQAEEDDSAELLDLIQQAANPGYVLRWCAAAGQWRTAVFSAGAWRTSWGMTYDSQGLARLTSLTYMLSDFEVLPHAG